MERVVKVGTESSRASRSAIDVSAVRALLDADRLATSGRMTALNRDREGIVDATRGVSTDDEHDPEGATIAFERAQIIALVEGAGRRLAEIDLALAALDQGRYGTCEGCGQPIGAARLEARPAATACIRCAGGPR